MSEEQKDIAQVYTIKQQPKQLSDLIFDIREKYISQCVASFDEFCIDELYKYYQQLGFTKVFVVNRTEFEKFILWALPLWKKHQEQEIEYPTLREFIKEYECGTYHTFKFFTDGLDFKCCNISDFCRYYNENLLDQYIVVDFEHKVFNNSCDQYADEYNLRIKKKGN